MAANKPWQADVAQFVIGLYGRKISIVKIVEALREKFPGQSFKYSSVKSWLFRERTRDHTVPKRDYGSKWNLPHVKRCIEIAKSRALTSDDVLKAISSEFPDVAIDKRWVVQTLERYRRKSRDVSARLSPRMVPEAIKARVLELCRTTNMSAHQIAQQLTDEGHPTTKGAVSGITFRERAAGNLICSQGKKRPGAKPPGLHSSARERWQKWETRQGGDYIRHAIKAAKAVTTKSRNQERREALKALHSDNAVHITERSWNQCAWPLWTDATPFSEKMFCGTATEAPGCPYCKGHCEMAYGQRVPGHFVPMKGFVNSWRAA